MHYLMVLLLMWFITRNTKSTNMESTAAVAQAAAPVAVVAMMNIDIFLSTNASR